MTDKSRDGGINKPANRSAPKQAHGKPSGDAEAARGNSGLDISGQFRVGERISIGVRGSDIVLTQSHSGREVVVAEAALAGLLDDTYFVDKVD